MKKYSKSFKAFLNKHKRIKRFVYETRAIEKGSKRLFFILPLVVVLLLGLGEFAYRPKSYAELRKETGIIRNVELYKHEGAKGGFSRYLFFTINDESYRVRISDTTGIINKTGEDELIQKIRNLEVQNTVVTVACSEHIFEKISLFELSTAEPVADIRTENEIIISVENTNKYPASIRVIIYCVAAIPAVLWLIMLYGWLEPLFRCYKDKKTKDSRRNK